MNKICPGCDIELVEIRKNERVIFYCNGCGANFEECAICKKIRSLWDRDGVCCACAMRKKYLSKDSDEIINLTEEG